MKLLTTLFLALLASLCSCSQSSLPSESDIWIDPSLNLDRNGQHIVVWFSPQFLQTGDAYQRKIQTFEGKGRLKIRKEVVQELKHMSEESFGAVKDELLALEADGQLTGLTQHWIVNGFSCKTTSKGLATIMTLEGISKIFQKQASNSFSRSNIGPEYLENIPPSRFDAGKVESLPWNIRQIRAQEVWDEYDINGEGVLNVIHDSGFKLDIPPLAESIYTNEGEIPGNNIDDDQNGYTDDYHGFNFGTGTADINGPNIRRGSVIHGNICAAIVSGTFSTDGYEAVGVAPGSKWAPVIGGNIEESVEWAIEQEADTYSMSFSQPNLGEFRTHWRKVMEQGSFCGIVFISGAGNFAAGSNFAPVPVQMRNPEDIPDAVLGVAGIDKEGNRPVFSSQGPVEWQTEHYKDGQVNKPDFATFNYQITCVDLEGKLSATASGNSLSGPHMAGIVSLMLSANPNLNPWDIKKILIETAEDIGAPGFDYQSGYGFVNAFDAVSKVLGR